MSTASDGVSLGSLRMPLKLVFSIFWTDFIPLKKFGANEGQGFYVMPFWIEAFLFEYSSNLNHKLRVAILKIVSMSSHLTYRERL